MKKFAVLIVCALILAAGVAAAVAFLWTAPEPAEAPPSERGTLVETLRVERKTRRVDLHAKGTVRAARRVRLVPQVSGVLVETHPELLPGGVVEKDALLARVDPRDYEQALKAAEAALTRARSALRLEEGRGDVAAREWELLEDKEDLAAADRELALREPQLESARARVKAAESERDRARLNLERTGLRAPFPAVVLDESADVGRFVSPGTAVATLVGTEAFRVEASVPAEALRWISFPDGKTKEGSEVVVRYDAGGVAGEWRGRVRRRVPSVAPRGRMARILVRVDDPLGLAEDPERRLPELPLLLGSYVDVRIEEVRAAEWIEIPRKALRGGNRVWVFADGRLEIREVEVAWRKPDHVLVSKGLRDGDRVVLTNLATAVPGLKLRLEPENGKRRANPGGAR